jgi:hypothetical protein
MAEKEVQYLVVSSEAVRDGSHKCNSANLWPESTKPPWNYADVCRNYNFSKWAEKPGAQRIVLHRCRWLVRAAALYETYCRITVDMRDTIEEYCLLDKGVVDSVLAGFGDPEGPFVRGEACSLKYGAGGPLRFTRLADILEALITAPKDHSPLRGDPEFDSSGSLILWALPWVSIRDEFRVFVHNNAATAMSQQAWHVPRARSQVPSKELVLKMGRAAEAAVTRAALGNGVVDVGILEADVEAGAGADPDEVYVIEINPFGPQFSSGSSLFEWHRDAAILHGLSAAAMTVAVNVAP